MSSAVPPLPGAVPCFTRVSRVPGTELVHLAIAGGGPSVGLVLDRQDARTLARDLERAVGGVRVRAAGRAHPPKRSRPTRALESRG